MKRNLIFWLAGLLVFAGSAVWGQPAAGEKMTLAQPEQLQWKPVPSLPPGAEIAVIEGDLKAPEPFTFRLRLPAGYRIPAHTHPAVERVTVLSGTFYLGEGEAFDTAAAERLPSGSIAILPEGMTMYAFTEEETVLQIHGEGPWGITYANPEEDPRPAR